MICVCFINCATFSNANEINEEISVFIPRDLFFIGGSEEHFLSYFEEMGGVIGKLDEDTQTFWRNYSTNRGKVYIEVVFLQSDLITIGLEIENELNVYLDIITNAFASIYSFEREINENYTKFIIKGDYDEFVEDPNIIELLDFVFPDMGVMEYLYRIFNQYKMVDLKEIVFYLREKETSKLFRLYSFFDDAPVGLGSRHRIEQ